MPERPVSDDRLIAYLLGNLAENERGRVEEEYFADDDVFEQLSALENELIDDYVEGDLSDSDRRRFENYFLSSARRRAKLELAKSLIKYLSRRSDATLRTAPGSPLVSWWQALLASLRADGLVARFALAAGALVVLLAYLLITVRYHQLRSELMQTKAQQEQLKQEAQELRDQMAKISNRPGRGTPTTEQEIAQLQPPGASVATLALSGGESRSAGEQYVLVMGSGTAWVCFQLDLERDEYPTYRATLQTAKGKEILRESGLKSQPSRAGYRVILLWLPSSLLENDDYLLKVSGVTSAGKPEELNVYAFRAVKN